MKKIVNWQFGVTGSSEIQNVNPILAIDAGWPTVRYLATISTKWVPGVDHQLSIASGANLAAPDP